MKMKKFTIAIAALIVIGVLVFGGIKLFSRKEAVEPAVTPEPTVEVTVEVATGEAEDVLKDQ